MFDKNGFIAFVGKASGVQYAIGLSNIEKVYSVNIDEEFARDYCVQLLSTIETDKKAITGNDRHNRQNWASHLKKYVEYKGQQPAERQKQRFIVWMKQQPQKNHPDKLYAETTVIAAANYLQNGLQRLAVPGYENTNCFTITDLQVFQDLYNACYAAATEFDKNAGFRDFRNGLDFYLQYLGESVGHAHDPEMLQMIRFIIDHYKENFEKVNQEERYKWEAQQWYRSHWQIDASDFASMLQNAFSKTGNLLNSGPNSLAYTQICEFSRDDPECIRTAFAALYDETQPLADRIEQFKKVIKDKIDEGIRKNPDTKQRSSYQDLHAISVYLAFEYPEKYFIYKASCYMKFSRRIGYQENTAAPNYSIRKLENLEKLCQMIIGTASEQADFITLHKARLDANCYQDDALHFLAQDIVFYGSEYMEDELFAARAESTSKNPLLSTEEEEIMNNVTDIGLNTILYGPPGTGKTYHTAFYAVAIIENKKLDAVRAEAYPDVLKRYNAYKAQGRIAFTTFHQSYGYEEFIEGIRPTDVDEGEETATSNIRYSVQPGIFKAFCEIAGRPVLADKSADDFGIRNNATVWKVSLEGTYDNPTRTECLDNGHIRIGWDSYGKDITDATDFTAHGGRDILNAFINKMQIGDIVFSCYTASTIDAIGVVTGEYEWHDEYPEYKRLRKVTWLAKGIRENILALNGGTTMTLSTVYRLSRVALSDAYALLKKHLPAQQIVTEQKDNYVFIIDEINRGNISKIFGELITLIEESKRIGRDEEMQTTLPYSMRPFGVPANVYILGTMNTADRSIATIDTALRRRFAFKEMLPNTDVIANISVDGISIKALLEQMNRRIAVLYDREHTIGHAYFLPLAKDNSLAKLAEIFKNNVIPLLQEYFYEDYEKIRLVLGDNQKKNTAERFILANPINQSELFGSADIGLDDGFTYEINESAFMNPEAYRLI